MTLPPTSPRTHVVTQLLAKLQAGDSDALERLVPLVYAELHEIAERQMQNERPDHTLQPTLLVNEAFLRLVGQGEFSWQSRAQFIAVAAQAMRRLLVDHARGRQAEKRGGAGLVHVPLDENLVSADPLDYADLDEALTRLAELDARQAKIVELRYFAGLTVDEIAETLGVSAATVKRDWQFAKVWLRAQLE